MSDWETLSKIPLSEMDDDQKLLFLKVLEEKKAEYVDRLILEEEHGEKISPTFGRKVSRNLKHAIKDVFDFGSLRFISSQDEENNVKGGGKK